MIQQVIKSANVIVAASCAEKACDDLEDSGGEISKRVTAKVRANILVKCCDRFLFLGNCELKIKIN